MKIGFTGSRKGLTRPQLDRLAVFLMQFKDFTLIHGGCVGADEELHRYMRSMNKELEVEIYPSTIEKYRADFVGRNIKEHPEQEALKRNKDIVDASDILLAAPHLAHEVPRSGTWSTVRYAYKMKKQVYIVDPDGTLTKFSPYGDGPVAGKKRWRIPTIITREHKEALHRTQRRNSQLAGVLVNGEPTAMVCLHKEHENEDGVMEMVLEPLFIAPTASMEITLPDGTPLSYPSAEEYLGQ